MWGRRHSADDREHAAERDRHELGYGVEQRRRHAGELHDGHALHVGRLDGELGGLRLKRARPWWYRLDANAASIAAIPDETIDAATPEQRAELAGIWQERASSELKVGATFAGIHAMLAASGAEEAVLAIARDAVPDEEHHARIAAALAARYRGDGVRWPGEQIAPLPLFVPAEPGLRLVLLVTTVCCINETLACNVLEGQLRESKSPLVRAGYQSILADEIDHGRMGWAHLGSRWVTKEQRAEIGLWLPRLLEARFRELFDPHPLPGAGGEAHGILPRKDRQSLIHAGLEEVVFPGFRHIGVDPTHGEAWMRDAFG